VPFILMSQFQRCRTRFLGLLIVFCLKAVCAQIEPDLQNRDYENAIGAVESLGREYVLLNGKQALVDEYLSIIQRFPDRDKNLRLEVSAAYIWLWELRGTGEIRCTDLAFSGFENAIARYPSDTPFMKNARLIAAGAMRDELPSRSAELYQSLVDDYPEDAAIQLEAYVGLGDLATNAKELDKAREYYAVVIEYDWTGLESSEDMHSAKGAMGNAAVGLLTLPLLGGFPEEVKLAKLKQMLIDFPRISNLKPDLVREYYLSQLEKPTAVPATPGASQIIEHDASISGLSAAITPSAPSTNLSDKTFATTKPISLEPEGMKLNVFWWPLSGATLCLVSFIFLLRR